MRRIPLGNFGPISFVPELTPVDLVRVNDHGRGAVALATHERPQFVRPVVESIIGVVVEVVEELDFSVVCPHQVCNS